MADPLSIAASIAGLIALGLHVSHALSQVISNTRSAPDAIKSLNLQLVCLCKALGGFSTFLESEPLESIPGFPIGDLSELLENIMRDFEHLQSIVNGYKVDLADGTIRQRWKQFLSGLQQGNIDTLAKNIEAYKATLSLTMSFAVVSIISHLNETTEQIRNQMTEVGKEMREVRSLCQQLRDGFAFPAAPLREIARDIAMPMFQASTNNSSVSNNTAASSYRAASIIDCYCDGIESLYNRPEMPSTSVTRGIRANANELLLPTLDQAQKTYRLSSSTYRHIADTKLGYFVITGYMGTSFIDLPHKPSIMELCGAIQYNFKSTYLMSNQIINRRTPGAAPLEDKWANLTASVATTYNLKNPEAWLEKARTLPVARGGLKYNVSQRLGVRLIVGLRVLQDAKLRKATVTPGGTRAATVDSGPIIWEKPGMKLFAVQYQMVKVRPPPSEGISLEPSYWVPLWSLNGWVETT